jgi:hypothetical protein
VSTPPLTRMAPFVVRTHSAPSARRHS